MITYSELKKLETYEERLSKLLLRGTPYESPRQIVLDFFKSSAWLTRRKEIIDRDYASDLGVIGQDIYGKIYVHHIDPITEEDVKRGDPKLLDPENLITTSHHTHMTIHYQYYEPYVERRPGDTKLW